MKLFEAFSETGYHTTVVTSFASTSRRTNRSY